MYIHIIIHIICSINIGYLYMYAPYDVGILNHRKLLSVSFDAGSALVSTQWSKTEKLR